MAEPVFEASNFFVIYPGNTKKPKMHHKCVLIYTDAPIYDFPPNITHVWCYVDRKLFFLSPNVTYLYLGKKYTSPIDSSILDATSLKTLVVKNESLLSDMYMPPTVTKLYGNRRNIELDIAKFTKPKNVKMINGNGNRFDIPARRYELCCINTAPFPVTKTVVLEGQIHFKICSENGAISCNNYILTGLHIIEDLVDEKDRSKVIGWKLIDPTNLNHSLITSLKYNDIGDVINGMSNLKFVAIDSVTDP